ncbi:hypothetical protein [Kribbella italica]|uniref:Uncharacterized protein n=1 Tax=Kribbella italica TaxID=1540520 RepID=A0A7W9J7W7_9ACTN|nr:hypothetical protein [Kribbella italica]
MDRLTARGWSTESAHHSYTEGSRYKGLHIFLRAHGELIEVQVHSRESIAVKEETTAAYEIERDHRQPQHLRDEMLTFAVGCSAELTQPAGIETLTNLGGVPVERRSYGRERGTTPRASKELPPTTETERGQEPQERWRDDGRDGLAR